MWCFLNCMTFLLILAQQCYTLFMQTIPESMFFFLAFFLFCLTNKNIGLYNQGNSIWVRFKPQLCSRRADSALPTEKHGVVNLTVYQGGWKYHFCLQSSSGLFQQLLKYTEEIQLAKVGVKRVLNRYHLCKTTTVDVRDRIWLTGWWVVTSHCSNWSSVKGLVFNSSLYNALTYWEAFCFQKWFPTKFLHTNLKESLWPKIRNPAHSGSFCFVSWMRFIHVDFFSHHNFTEENINKYK